MSTKPAVIQQRNSPGIISILSPPQCASQAENAIKSGEEIGVVLHNGKIIKATLQQFSRDEKKLVCLIDGSDIPKAVPFVKIKYLLIPREFSFVTDTMVNDQTGTMAQTMTSSFLVEFKDEQKLEGKTIGCRTDASGLFLYPSTREGEYTVIFIPHSSMEQYRVDDPVDKQKGDAAELPEANIKAATTPQLKKSNIIPVLLPPQCAPQIENAITTGEKIVIYLHNGQDIKGGIQQFQRVEKNLVYQTDDNGSPQTIQFVKIKYVEIPREFNFVPNNKSAAPAQQITTDFMVEFKDEQRLEGKTMGCRTEAVGLFIYPSVVEGKYTSIFIPHSSMEGYHIEKSIDENKPTDPEVTVDVKNMVMNEIVDPVELRAFIKQMKAMPKMRVGEILVKENLISEESLQQALEVQQDYKEQGKKMQIGEVLIDLQLITQSNLLNALSKKLGIPFIDLNKFKLDVEALQYVPEDLVRKYLILPLHKHKNTLIVALENPMDFEALDAVRFHANLNIEPVMSTRVELDRMIDVLYTTVNVSGSLFDDYLSEDTDEDVEEEYSESNVEDNVIVKLVNKIIIDAYQRGASDIHIEPYAGNNKTVVRIRKDGSLQKYYEVPSKMRAALVARIKIMAELDISEKRKPQDGKIDFKKFGALKIELRVATIPTSQDLEDVVMRILAGGEPVPLEKLGLSNNNFDLLKKLIARPYGLFFVCGPTGSGKTTTLHSILGDLNTPERKIWTAEDPVEITQRGLRQVQINNKTGFTFAKAMRAFLRADPDIIMVGEMRDKETTGVGIEASLTGHLVLATLHTNSAAESITRLLDMGMDPFNFADALIGILAQRLCKRLCSECKESYEPSDKEVNEIVAEFCFELIPKNADESVKEELHDKVLAEWKERYTNEEGKFTLAKARGCEKCEETGYRGRVGIHELLEASDMVKKNILENATVSKLTQIALQEGMRTLKQDGILKVLEGHTNLHSVRAVCIK